MFFSCSEEEAAAVAGFAGGMGLSGGGDKI